MKKLFALAAAVCLTAAAAFPQTLSLALRGGAATASGGDLAAGLSGLMDYYAAEYESVTGAHKFPSLGWTGGAELLLHLSPGLALGLGAGYEIRGKESVVTYGIDGIGVSESLTPKITSLPMTANLHLFLPLGGRIKIDLSAGAGLYLVRLDWTSRYDLSVLGYDGSDVFTFKGSRSGFGGQAGLGLEWALSDGLSAVLRVEGRLARVSGFSGDWTETGSGDFWTFAESGSGYGLYYYDWTPGSSTYPQIVFQESAPQGAAVSGAREARIDLTGITATAGIRLRLF